jgi:hypothetical protein
MEYKLLDSKKGFILTREPEIIDKNLYITFTGAPENATVIFESKIKGDTLYRELQDGMCCVPARFLCPILEDVIKVTVVVLDGKSNEKWQCEEIKTGKNISNNTIIVKPNDMNIPLLIVEVLLEQQKMKDDMKQHTDNFSELNQKLDKLLEGYDIT